MKDTRDQRLAIFSVEVHPGEVSSTYLFKIDSRHNGPTCDIQTAQYIVNEDNFNRICHNIYRCICTYICIYTICIYVVSDFLKEDC